MSGMQTTSSSLSLYLDFSLGLIAVSFSLSMHRLQLQTGIGTAGFSGNEHTRNSRLEISQDLGNKVMF